MVRASSAVQEKGTQRAGQRPAPPPFPAWRTSAQEAPQAADELPERRGEKRDGARKRRQVASLMRSAADLQGDGHDAGKSASKWTDIY
mmetsp:Transcript_34186/g.95389  ORF Transcript_34186/g.95389 Transcript_34186/m.95389 type:complete len:88 (+) Transcript_34186:238-501(+)